MRVLDDLSYVIENHESRIGNVTSENVNGEARSFSDFVRAVVVKKEHHHANHPFRYLQPMRLVASDIAGAVTLAGDSSETPI